jgi:hypothetical protein
MGNCERHRTHDELRLLRAAGIRDWLYAARLLNARAHAAKRSAKKQLDEVKKENTPEAQPGGQVIS